MNRAGTGLTIVIEKIAWENANQGQWRQKFFPQNYTTAAEQVQFVLYSNFDIACRPFLISPSSVPPQHASCDVHRG